jgi:hypothetical protein
MPWLLQAEAEGVEAVDLIASLRMGSPCSKVYAGLKQATGAHAILAQQCELLDVTWLSEWQRLPPGRRVCQLIHLHFQRDEQQGCQSVLDELGVTTLSCKAGLGRWLVEMTKIVPRLTEFLGEAAASQLSLKSYKTQLTRPEFDEPFMSAFRRAPNDKSVNHWTWLRERAAETLKRAHVDELEAQAVAAAKKMSEDSKDATALAATPGDAKA